jgi:dihydropyrimidine dehydrogenase (NAD+) subunit PreT
MSEHAAPDIRAGRLTAAEIAANFNDVKPPLDRKRALVESSRCFYCYDAPCIEACPTSIDVPSFIRSIAVNDPIGAAETILEANIMGGMCSRVCPVEILCEDACVRNHSEDKPVQIGALQRYATDALVANRPTAIHARAVEREEGGRGRWWSRRIVGGASPVAPWP